MLYSQQNFCSEKIQYDINKGAETANILTVDEDGRVAYCVTINLIQQGNGRSFIKRI